jgi:tripartite-type tricarboxylate transporter receptor subunit TctC
MKLARLAAPVFAGLVCTLPAGPIARAQDYPTRPVTLIAPWAAGGAVDPVD